MSSNENPSIRKVLTGADGKRETEKTLNQEKNLVGKFCSRPFDFLEAQDLGDGKVFVCCPTWLNVPVGKLSHQSVQEAFNSETNQEIRKSIFDGSFKYCNHKLCPMIQNESLPFAHEVTNPHLKAIIEKKQITDLTPTEYNLCYDPSCNLSCPSCRATKVYITEGPAYERKNIIQQKIINEVFGEAHTRYCKVSITGSGDPFGSKIFRELLFSIDGSKYPNVHISLQTNGVMFTEKYWEKMKKIQKNIQSVIVSLDASTESTYNVVRRGGNWSALLNNLEFISSLKEQGTIPYLRLDFVVQRENYKEMAGFVKIAKKFKATKCYFSLVSDWGTWPVEEYKKNAIWKKDHPEFSEFTKEMSNPIFDEPIVDLGNLTEYRRQACYE